MGDFTVTAIPAFSDNYIWALSDERHCTVVDPGDADAVNAWLRQHGLSLSAILVTHHHWDHTGGVNALADAHDVPVFGPRNTPFTGVTRPLDEGDEVTLDHPAITLTVLPVPGHTLDHIAYCGDGILLCGDTLFSAGCGRLFEGTPEQMYASLQRLNALPGPTQVYCTHEYTAANLRFAAAVEPHNDDIHAAADWTRERRANDEITLPTTLDRERTINPFLRTDEPGVVAAVRRRTGQDLRGGEAVFAALRAWKDEFRG